MDAGLVMGQSERTIDPSLTAGELHDLLAADGPDLMLRVLAEKQSDALRPVTQDESLVTIAGKLSRADGWVDLGASAEHCRRRIHGLTPWPGVTIRIGDDQLKVARVEALESGSEEVAGVLIDAASGVIACGEGTSLRLIEVQPAGKRIMAWAEYVRGNPIEVGAVVNGGAPC
jgi:methionyl-tRNA formyltransferase